MQCSVFRSLSGLLALTTLLAARPVLAQKYVCMESNKGQWCMELLRSAAPNTVNNFLRYVTSGAYNNMFFHRSIPGFVVQGGGFEIDQQGFIGRVPTYGNINNEFSRSNVRGTVAMAKLGSDPNSASNQWFINLADNASNLDVQNSGFTVFAEVAYGIDVIDRIAAMRVGNLSATFGSTEFGEVPVDIAPTSTTVARDDLVIVSRAYTTDVLPGLKVAPYHCSAVVPNETLTELCGGEVSMPVNVQGLGSYEVTLQLQSSKPAMVFAIKPGSLKLAAAFADGPATYNPATLELTIPSVRSGTNFFYNVKLKLTSAATQQFTLQSFTLP